MNLEEYKGKYLQFVEAKDTAVLSMLDMDGHPFSSCAPFVKLDGKLYIYISEIAEHYQLLEKNELVDVLLIADEGKAKNAFATERVRWKCVPKNIGNEGNDAIFELFGHAHGQAMIDMLRGLDFSLFELRPINGRYVVGFGLAFDLDMEKDTFTHVVVDKSK